MAPQFLLNSRNFLEKSFIKNRRAVLGFAILTAFGIVIIIFSYTVFSGMQKRLSNYSGLSELGEAGDNLKAEILIALSFSRIAENGKYEKRLAFPFYARANDKIILNSKNFEIERKINLGDIEISGSLRKKGKVSYESDRMVLE